MTAKNISLRIESDDVDTLYSLERVKVYTKQSTYSKSILSFVRSVGFLFKEREFLLSQNALLRKQMFDLKRSLLLQREIDSSIDEFLSLEVDSFDSSEASNVFGLGD